MRDLLNELLDQEQRNPMEAARRNMRPALRKRFYKSASIGEGNALLLDGKPVRSPARRLLAAPHAHIAEALAAEWNAQGEAIDPATMPLTRLANAIIDGVADQPDAVRGEIEKYLHSDLVFYRADSPEGLVARQAELWDPFVNWARDSLDARFVLAQGVMHQAQPPHAVEVVAKTIPRDLWRLGAAASLTTITGSALIALAVAAGAVTAEHAWASACVDEDWNMETWGRDEDALQRRTTRQAEFDAAALVLKSAA
jgi:chaperone required for assembly of F1-ATPase